MVDKIKDIKLEPNLEVKNLVSQFQNVGFQASNLTRGVELIKEMKREDCTLFLSFTSNLIASGIRGVIKEFISKGFVDVIVTAGGAIDHDIIRSLDDYLLGDFQLDDVRLHEKGINRLGNILVPNERYGLFEGWIQKVLVELYDEKKVVSPKELIEFIGGRIHNKGSILRLCVDKGIPVFSPGVVDSALGLQLFFFKQEHPDFAVDVTRDFRDLSDIVSSSKKTGGVILGGGISKHYVIGANLLRGGLDYGVYVTTASFYDGSLSGATPNEAKSWGKIKEKGSVVTVYGDASIIFPLMVASL